MPSADVGVGNWPLQTIEHPLASVYIRVRFYRSVGRFLPRVTVPEARERSGAIKANCQPSDAAGVQVLEGAG